MAPTLSGITVVKLAHWNVHDGLYYVPWQVPMTPDNGHLQLQLAYHAMTANYGHVVRIQHLECT